MRIWIRDWGRQFNKNRKVHLIFMDQRKKLERVEMDRRVNRFILMIKKSVLMEDNMDIILSRVYLV